MSSIAIVKTICFCGIDVLDVEVQVHMAKGQPGFTIVGLGDKAVAESKERIRAVLSTLGIILPPSRITINLAPADVIKEGTHYDLPIALGLLVGLGVIRQEQIENFVSIGELGLDGTIRSVNGVLPASLYAVNNGKGIICPLDNGPEAAWVGENANIIATDSVAKLIACFKGKIQLPRPQITTENYIAKSNLDMHDVRGQKTAKRAMEIAAAGGHNILLIGAPGTGKSMLAQRINTILPPLNNREMLEVSMIHSIAGLIKNGVLSSVRPFRSPHHSASMPSIIGGGRNAKPGEITLAHNGVLFLDELPEYPRFVLDSLRQPLENGEVCISRINSKVIYPAQFQLVAAMNPCKCGYYGSQNHKCTCSQNSIKNYQSRVSGPLLDRIDIYVKMEDLNTKFSDISSTNNEEYSESIAKRVAVARQIQNERFKNETYKLNANITGSGISKYCLPKDSESTKIIDQITEKLKISMRGMSKILKVARTIADLDGSVDVKKEHILEATLLRNALEEIR